MSDREIRAYLLGQATEAEAESLEARLLEDEDVFATLRGVEDDLFDEYARGGLSADERQQFLERYGAERGRLLVAHALAARNAPPRILSFRRFERRWMPAAAAAALVAGGAVLTVWMRARPAENRSADRAPASLSHPAPAVLLITLGTSRSDSTVPEVALQTDTAALELRVRLNPADRFDAYSMELRSASGVLAWRADNLHAERNNGDVILAGAVPASALTAGPYELSVRGSTAAAPQEVLGFATVSVRR